MRHGLLRVAEVIGGIILVVIGTIALLRPVVRTAGRTAGKAGKIAAGAGVAGPVGAVAGAVG